MAHSVAIFICLQTKTIIENGSK